MYSHQIEILPEQFPGIVYPESKPVERSRLRRSRFQKRLQ